ncbi:MAG TPA: tRNA lysidine(34) synthetase TilS, partial [Candidatus Moranbacteria bacterium]|nr:tRNA lysidine(34) synthetase TilS [Candidatus Moranbacteria bacterium]
SACLFHILFFLSKKYDFSLRIAHINYGLRGKDSEMDEKFVRDLANNNNVEISVLNLKKATKNENSENALRKIRYEFFEKVRKEIGFDLIAVAHNQNDQAETVLMRLMRGSGLQGIASIKPKNNRIIRPLLAISRKEILQYLKENNLKHRTDKTNLEPIFLRNKVRLKLLPYLEKTFNPKIQESLANFASSAADDFDFIDEFSAKKCSMIVRKENTIEFRVEDVLKLHFAIQRQYLRNAISMLKNDLIDIELANIEEMLKIIKSKKSKSQKYQFKGLNMERKGGMVKLCLIKK